MATAVITIFNIISGSYLQGRNPEPWPATSNATFPQLAWMVSVLLSLNICVVLT